MDIGQKLTTSDRGELFWLQVKGMALNAIGLCLEKIEAPAKLEEFEFIDPDTNETIYLSTGRRYSVLHVRGRRFFFDRITGTFDGTANSLQISVTNGLELRD